MSTRARLDTEIAVATVVPLAAIPVLHVTTGLPALVLGPLLLLGAPHVLATLGLYVDREIGQVVARDRMRYLVVPLLAIPLAVAAFWAAPRSWLLLLVAASFSWQVAHYTKQNVGMFAFWCRARGLDAMTRHERAVIGATTAAGVIGVLRAVALVPAWSTELQAGGLVVVAGCLVAGLRRAAGGRAAALAVAALFYVPLLVSAPGLLGIAFAYQASHGAQYYLMVGRALQVDRRALWVSVLAVVCIGPVAIPMLAPAVVAAPAIYGLGKGLAFSHFIADARLWRLRDPDLGPILRRRFAGVAPAATAGLAGPEQLQTTPP
ncbi:MAG: hypothetical protein KDA97_02975 [Acidimicrobiales bacterium]|nr:hypothetical protein [Acidimicrobiales bacterium]